MKGRKINVEEKGQLMIQSIPYHLSNTGGFSLEHGHAWLPGTGFGTYILFLFSIWILNFFFWIVFLFLFTLCLGVFYV